MNINKQITIVSILVDILLITVSFHCGMAFEQLRQNIEKTYYIAKTINQGR